MRPYTSGRVANLVSRGLVREGMTVSELAEASNVSVNSVHRILQREGVRLETLQAVLNTLGYELGYGRKT